MDLGPPLGSPRLVLMKVRRAGSRRVVAGRVVGLCGADVGNQTSVAQVSVSKGLEAGDQKT